MFQQLLARCSITLGGEVVELAAPKDSHFRIADNPEP